MLGGKGRQKTATSHREHVRVKENDLGTAKSYLELGIKEALNIYSVMYYRYVKSSSKIHDPGTVPKGFFTTAV
jgi:hypothetical protein